MKTEWISTRKQMPAPGQFVLAYGDACEGSYMIDKPNNLGPLSGRQAGIEAAYLRLRGFAFFFASSVRSLGGVASIRRASSSKDMGGCCGLGLAVMGGSCG